MNKERFTRFKRTAFEHICPDGKKRLGNAGSFRQREAIGDRKGVRLVNDAIFGIATTRHEGADFVAQFESGSVRTDGNNFTGNFKTGYIGRAGRRWISPLPLQDIGTVNARCRNTHENFPRARLGQRPDFRNQNIRPTGFPNGNGCHGLGKRIGHESFPDDLVLSAEQRRG